MIENIKNCKSYARLRQSQSFLEHVALAVLGPRMGRAKID